MIIDKYTDNQFSIDFTYSAAVNMLGSLHIMANPDHHPETTGFIRRKREALPEELRERIDAFGRDYSEWAFVSDIMMKISAKDCGRRLAFDESLEKMFEMDQEEFAYVFLGLPAFDYDHGLLRGWMNDPATLTEESFGIQKLFIGVEKAKAFLEDIDGMRKNVADMLRCYWDCCFEKEWRDIAEYFDSVIYKESVKLQQSSYLSYLSELHEDLSVNDGEIVFHKDPDFSIDISKVRRVIINLSVFNSPHLNGNIEGDTVYIIENLRLHAVRLNDPIAGDLFGVIYAASDKTRLKIIKMLWNSNCTTKEIAEVLGLSSSTVSMHLKILKENDLVETTKVKKYVFYGLKKHRVTEMQDKLIEYFDY